MNNNLLKYPIRFGTLMLAGAALVACKKEAFTEKDALALEFTRSMHKRFVDSLANVQATKLRYDAMRHQFLIDSLNRANAGGRVNYTVIPVNGSSTVFSNGGRAENAVTTAKVTISQYGKTVTADAGTNGVFNFSDLRSGEVTVNITAAGFTDVSYISNLTPDGGVSNNSIVYVGNIIPMFENASTNQQRMAVVKGRAYVETDLTNDREEFLSPAVLNAGGGNSNNTGVGTAAIVATATIDSQNGNFASRFLSENNDEGGSQYYNTNNSNIAVRSGRIQRIGYGIAGATAGTNVGTGTLGAANGEYGMLVPAAANGLPIMMNFAEFATNRTYYRVENGVSKIVNNERFLYGPKVVASSVPVGVPAPTVSFQAFTTAAAATAVFTPQSTTTNSSLANPSNTSVAGGFYLVTPTATVGSGTATATATTAKITPGNNTTITGAAATGFAGNTVASVALGGTNSGYTADGIALTFTRRDTALIGTGLRVESSTGSALIGMATGTGQVQVVDGGGNFNFNTATSVSTPGTFTNVVPRVVFTETDQITSSNPSVTFTTPGVVAGAGQIFFDYNANYGTVNGQRAVTGITTGVTSPNGGVGAVQEVQITSAGQYPAPGPFVGFSFGEAVNIAGFQTIAGAITEANNDLFESAGGGSLRFNTTYPIANEVPGAVMTSNTTITFNNGFGSGYVYVPQVALAPNNDLATALGAAETSKLQTANIFTTTVSSNPADAANFGQITSISINSAAIIPVAVGFGAAGIDFMAPADAPATATTPGIATYGGATGAANPNRLGISITPTRAGNTLKAVSSQPSNRIALGGSGLTNYTVSAAGLAKANSVAVLAGGISSNSTSSPITTGTQDYVDGNEMLVLFSAPTNTSASGRKYAWGVPVWDVTATNDNTILTGVRILDAGVGYESGKTYAAYLVPNPFFKGNRVNNSVVSMPTPVAPAVAADPVWASPAAFPADASGSLGNMMPWFFNGRIGSAKNTTLNRSTSTVLASLTFTIGTAGAGYSEAPRVVFYGGGLDLTAYSGATGAGGVLEFATKVNTAGGVTEIIRGEGPAPAPTTNANLTRASLNKFEFADGTAPSSWTATTTFSIKFVDNLSLALTNEFRNQTDGGVGGKVNISADGKVSSITLQRPSKFSVVTTGQFTGTEVIAPLVFVSAPTSGTTATATASVTLDPQAKGSSVGYPDDTGNVNRKVTRITVTNGGSGYSRGNVWQRLNTTGNMSSTGASGYTVDGTTAEDGQNFWIVGGDMQTAGNAGNWKFDVFPGMTYVRDIHYGTGKELD